MLIEQEELKSLIPHRGKMLLLDRVTEYSPEGYARAEYQISESCLFYNAAVGGVPSWAGFEFMAQTISAYSGIYFLDKEIKPKTGFILSIPSMKMYIPVFKTGSLLEISVHELDHTDLIYTFEGKIFLEGEMVMEGKLMVMEIYDEKQYNEFINQ